MNVGLITLDIINILSNKKFSITELKHCIPSEYMIVFAKYYFQNANFPCF